MKTIPNSIFAPIIGYEEEKELLKAGLQSPERVSFVLVGSPASGKSMLLEAIHKLGNSVYAIGGGTSRSGLSEVLFKEKPKYLILDEADKCYGDELSILLSLCESGRVRVIKHKFNKEIFLDTKVFMAANSILNMPPELISRFVVLKFPDYSTQQAYNVMVGVLTIWENTTPETAHEIARRVVYELGSRNVRDAVKIYRLSKGGLSLEQVLQFLKYNQSKQMQHYDNQITPNFLNKGEINDLILYLDLARSIIARNKKLYMFQSCDTLINKLKKQLS